MKAPQFVIDAVRARLNTAQRDLASDEQEIAVLQQSLKEVRAQRERDQDAYQQIADWLRSQGESV